MTADSIHDGEADTSQAVALGLPHRHYPALARHPLTLLDSTGTSNRLWTIGGAGDGTPVATLRLPRTASAAVSLASEIALLPPLRTRFAAPPSIPRLLHAGEPDAGFPYRWAILDWLPGQDLFAAPPATRHPATAVAVGGGSPLYRHASAHARPPARQAATPVRTGACSRRRSVLPATGPPAGHSDADHPGSHPGRLSAAQCGRQPHPFNNWSTQ